MVNLQSTYDGCYGDICLSSVEETLKVNMMAFTYGNWRSHSVEWTAKEIIMIFKTTNDHPLKNFKSKYNSIFNDRQTSSTGWTLKIDMMTFTYSDRHSYSAGRKAKVYIVTFTMIGCSSSTRWTAEIY